MSELITGILYLIAILTVLVVAHEWGHYIVARLFGMRVDEFAIFFGPVLWRIGKRGDTVFNLRTVPIGGFCKIAGMEADDISGGRPILEALRHGPETSASMDQMLREMDADTMAGIDVAKVGQQVRDMVRSSVGPDGRLSPSGVQDLKAAVLSPKFNPDEVRFVSLVLNAEERAADPHLYSRKPIYQRALVIAAGPIASILFAYLVFCSLGMSVGLPDGHRTNVVADVIPDYPAHQAGLQVGDRIVAVGSVKVTDGASLVAAVSPRAGKPTILRVQRGSRDFLVRLTPRKETFMENGKQVTRGLIGVQPNETLRRVSVLRSIRDGTIMTRRYVDQLVKVLIVERRVKENLGGPIAMEQMTNAAQRLGFAHVLMIAAPLSLSLGILNLLPIPILDGGHLLLLAIEKARRRKLTAREIYRAQVIGLGILAALIVFVMINDISRTINGLSIQ